MSLCYVASAAEKVDKPLEIGKKYIVLTEEGKVLSGTLRRVGKETITLQTKFREEIIDRSSIEEIIPAKKLEEDEQSWPPEDSVKFLKQLKQRDAKFDSRTLEIERRWTDHIDPMSEIAARRFADFKFGNPDAEYPSDDERPEPYDQPHRVVSRLTVRELEVTLDIVEDLEEIKHSEFGMKANRGLRWSTVGGVERTFSPDTNIIRENGEAQMSGVLRMYQRSYEWGCGYGVAKWMKSIDSMQMKDDHLLVTGRAELIGGDKTFVEMELDEDLIVRRAVISIAAKSGGFDQYAVETAGIVKPKGTPPVAGNGRYRRILKPADKPDHVSDDYNVVFVSLSGLLGDMAYSKRTKITPNDKTEVIKRRRRKSK